MGLGDLKSSIITQNQMPNKGNTIQDAGGDDSDDSIQSRTTKRKLRPSMFSNSYGGGMSKPI